VAAEDKAEVEDEVDTSEVKAETDSVVKIAL
jgi:hypothetical protein